jgi:hypothetical protein
MKLLVSAVNDKPSYAPAIVSPPEMAREWQALCYDGCRQYGVCRLIASGGAWN